MDVADSITDQTDTMDFVGLFFGIALVSGKVIFKRALFFVSGLSFVERNFNVWKGRMRMGLCLLEGNGCSTV